MIKLNKEFIDFANTITRINSKYKFNRGAKVMINAVAEATGGTAIILINKSRLYARL